jgi:ABC-2 type transport system ATP-binding protein
MPRTEPAPTWPFPTSWNTDFAVGKRRSHARNRCSAGTSQRVRQKGAVGSSHASPSDAARAHTSATVRQPRRRANHSGTENEKSKPATTGGGSDSTHSTASSRDVHAWLSAKVPSRTIATQMPFGRRAPDQSTAITESPVTAPRYGFRVSEIVLSARGLVKDYRRDRAVDGVSFDVHGGERVALLGPNGAGKTTTLLMILGAISPDAGDVTIDGIDLARDRSRAAERVGFAAGYLPLTERMRVCEYLKLYAQLYGIADPDPLIDAGLESFRIAHLARAMGTELSSGQRTLIGIVRATLHRPRLLVLDEPTASLDPDVAQRVRNGLLELCDRDGTALLMTSHDMSDVEQVCERVIFLSHGHVVADGTPAEITNAYGRGNLEGVFLHLADRHEPAGAQQSDHP